MIIIILIYGAAFAFSRLVVHPLIYIADTIDYLVNQAVRIVNNTLNLLYRAVYEVYFRFSNAMPATRAMLMMVRKNRSLGTLKNYFWLLSAREHADSFARALCLLTEQAGNDSQRPFYEYRTLFEVGARAADFSQIMVNIRAVCGGEDFLGATKTQFLKRACDAGVLEDFSIALIALHERNLATTAHCERLLTAMPNEIIAQTNDIIRTYGVEAGNNGARNNIDENNQQHIFGFVANQMLFAAQGLFAGLPSIVRYHDLPAIERRSGVQAPIFQTLLNRIRDNEAESRGGSMVIEAKIQPVLQYFNQNPQQLRWANEISEQVQAGCVNQPLTGWLEISAWVHLASAGACEYEKLKAAGYILAVEQVKDAVVRDCAVSSSYKPEANNVMLREVHDELGRRGVLRAPWVGLFTQVAHEHHNGTRLGTLAQWKDTPDVRDRIRQIADSVQHITTAQCRDTVLAQGRIWGEIAFGDRYRRIATEYADQHTQDRRFLRHVISFLTGEPLDDLLRDDIQQQQHQNFLNYLRREMPDYETASEDEKLNLVGPLNQRLQQLNTGADVAIQDQLIAWTDRMIAQRENNRQRCR